MIWSGADYNTSNDSAAAVISAPLAQKKINSEWKEYYDSSAMAKYLLNRCTGEATPGIRVRRSYCTMLLINMHYSVLVSVAVCVFCIASYIFFRLMMIS